MSDFAIADVATGQLNALVKNLMKQMDVADGNEAVRRINSGEWTVSQPIRSWREQDGVIYFSVTSDGTAGEAWIKRLEGNGFRVGDYAKQVLRSPDFKPTSSVTTDVAVLKGMLFKDNERITKKIRAEAERRKWTKPNAEIACLIREKFSDDELKTMGLWWIVTMHEPIKDSDGAPLLLDAGRSVEGRWLNSSLDRPDLQWRDGGAFAFVVPAS